MGYFIDALKKYAEFNGRARRKEYWMFYLMYIVVVIAATIIDTAIIQLPATIIIVVLGLIIPTLSITVRRLHDTGRSGWMFFISFVPVVGGLVFLIFMLQDSREDNEYGPNPKAV